MEYLIRINVHINKHRVNINYKMKGLTGHHPAAAGGLQMALADWISLNVVLNHHVIWLLLSKSQPTRISLLLR